MPNIAYISILKLVNEQQKECYYFRLFTDYFGEVEHPYVIEQQEIEIEQKPIRETERLQLSKARIGQGNFRNKLLKECPFCPITLVTDESVLVASHIKPWAKSNDFEKLDVKNGFLFTPTFDYLFDRGFLSFTSEKRAILSPFLSETTYNKLGISDNKIIPNLPINGREEYLEYHRSEILKLGSS